MQLLWLFPGLGIQFFHVATDANTIWPGRIVFGALALALSPATLTGVLILALWPKPR